MTAAVEQRVGDGCKSALELPPRWPWLFRKVRKYAHRYAARHFHAVRIARNAMAPAAWEGPAVVVLNHPSWWDPIMAFALSSRWPDRLDYAPIDRAALAKYKVLGRVGLFGVEQGTIAGAAAFLQTARAILAHERASLWITAQGRFTDVRDRPVVLMPGVGHVAAGMGRGVILPLALEYVFWDERTPEALAAFGAPIDVRDAPAGSARSWTRRIAEALEATQGRLAGDARSRDPARFETVVAGRVGVGGMYDAGRRVIDSDPGP